jgi:undecaprenyl-diphosphatase
MIDTLSSLNTIWGYLFVCVLSFGESLAFVGLIVPGSIVVIASGFLASQGMFDIWALFAWSSLGAILGDNFSYFLGRHGLIAFHADNKFFKPEILEKGKAYFEKHGDKSVFLGRFIGWVRPIVPFVAGVFRLNRMRFFFWNATSGILWSVSHIAFGYYFGDALEIVGAWATRAGFWTFAIIATALLLWILVRRSKPMFAFLKSVAVSARDAMIRKRRTEPVGNPCRTSDTTHED